jgi:hypothetical protein
MSMIRLLSIFVLGAVVSCTYNTNKPTNFGKTEAPPPDKKIERTPKQWCFDYCNKVRGCWESSPEKPSSADAAFAKCKADHQECEVTKVENVMCCGELTTCGDFWQCNKDGAPAGC